MSIRTLIKILIGTLAALWWLGLFLLQLLNIYPLNNFVLAYSSVSLPMMVAVLATYDYFTIRSLDVLYDFFPDVKGESPSLDEWFSKRVWRSMPRWFVGVTVFGIIITGLGEYSFSIPRLETKITHYIYSHDLLHHKTGRIKGYSYLRSGKSEVSKEREHYEMTIRVYSEKGNFPLQLVVDFVQGEYVIQALKINKINKIQKWLGQSDA